MMDPQSRRDHNEKFLQRLLQRRPQEREHYEERLRPATRGIVPEGVATAPAIRRDLVLETIVDEERPVLFVRDGQFDTREVTILGNEAKDLVDRMKDASNRLLPMLPLIGRIDVVNFPGTDFLGTAWFVDTDIVVTNRHVASLIAKWDGRQYVVSRGVGGRALESSLCNAHEFDDADPDSSRVFKIKEVLYIEPDSAPNDIAFLRVVRRTDGSVPRSIPIATSSPGLNVPVCVIGYPARASRNVIPDQALMQSLYRGRFDVKRAAPGFSTGVERGSETHDCTTLGGNSGSVILDLAAGQAVGLHFAGLYKEDNFAVPASILRDYVQRKRWNSPPVIETSPKKPVEAPTTSMTSTIMTSSHTFDVTIPVTITIGVGTPVVGAGTPGKGTGAEVLDVSRVEEALLAYWDNRPEGVLAARVGYLDNGDEIGDQPCIAASVMPDRWATFESTGARTFQGVPVRYLPAEVEEQLQAMPSVESVDSIAYDDDARTGEGFSFSQVNENMTVTMHVGPEYSWEVLETFLNEAQGRLVSAIYEFHAEHIKDALDERLRQGNSLTMVLDNLSFSKVKDEEEEFDRVEVFEEWANEREFTRVVAPEGKAGLISDAYHIKVTVRDDDTFWLSSGNWKAGSSQPIITSEQRDNATEVDLPGNREWHVVIKNKTLAGRFRNHILQDFERSAELGGGPVPKSMMEEVFVDVPIEETFVLERKPPSRVLEPKKISRAVRVRPLLTPDQQGEVYSEAVLELIRSATKSLLFQIPYIGMRPNPQEHRGFIDELISALTTKLKNLDDARVLLRSGSSKFSSPSHAAWFFKSKHVDIANRLRVIENHHTKGMIVDGRRVLLGSHNWSKPGVTLNRDASLIFDDKEIAAYYTDAFEVDWARANPVKPKRFERPEAVVVEAVGGAPPVGYRRVSLSEWLADD